MRNHILILLILTCCSHTYGQVISGIVMDANTKETIPNATVYYDQTFEGTTTDQNGNFKLKILNNRSLVFSAIGYYSTTISEYANIEGLSICLRPKVYDVGEVSVNSVSLEKQRIKNLRIFKKHFIGTSANARKCLILNEKDITFNYSSQSDTLKAYALKPIHIENRALGYKITYYLDKFEYSRNEDSPSTSLSGSFVFNEDLGKTGLSNKSYKWNRRYAYFGSRMHFVRSLFLDSLYSGDFEIRNQSYDVLKIKDLVDINKKQQGYLKNVGDIIIWYDGNRRSSIKFSNDSILIDKTGYYSDGMTWSGDMSRNRIADQLPYGYVAEPKINSTQPSDVASQLSNYCNQTHPEKLFVSTDRNIYAAGETIWFSSWIFNADDLSPEPYEKILYIDIFDYAGNIISQNLFTIDHGRSEGQINLGLGLSNGYYQFVAYTNYMKNLGNEFLFKKTIAVHTLLPIRSEEERSPVPQAEKTLLYSQTKNKLKHKQQQASDINISFLPEGGNWMVGIPGRIAFVGSQNGNDSLQFSGNIYDNQNNLVAVFKSEFNGRGAFIMTPKQNTQYHAKVVDHLGQTAMFSLPPPDVQGHTLTVQNINCDSLLNVVVYSSSQNIGTTDLTLTVSQHQRVTAEYKFRPIQKEFLVAIPKSELRTGLAQVTLFDSKQNPICERLVFVNNNDFLKFNIETTEISSYNPLKIDLHVTDKNDYPVQGKFAISLTENINNIDTALASPNLVQYIYLNSELPGLESQCNYFFLKDRKSLYKTELTLLTNGWRRFTWKDVLADFIPSPQFPLEQKFYIAGTVRKEKTGKPVKKAEVTLMGLGKRIIAGTTTTNDSGKFVFIVDSYDGVIDVTVQTKNDRNRKKDYIIELQTNLGKLNEKKPLGNRLEVHSTGLPVSIDSVQNNQITHTPVEADNVSITPFDHDTLLNDISDITLKEVEVNAKRILSPQEKMHSVYGPSSLTVGKQQLVTIDDHEKWNYGLFSVLDKIIPGLVISNKSVEARHMFDGVIKGLSKATSGANPCGPGRIPLCCCDSLEEDECYHIPGECYQFTYNGTSHFRLYFYVDGKLCAFTNHRAQVDWANNNFLYMSLDDIESVVFIQHPKNSALMDALSVSKTCEELYCEPITAAHILNNCMYGFDPAPEHIISIATKSGLGLSNSRKFKGIAKTRLVGFTLEREFYKPQSGSSRLKLVQKSPTLYWNPEIKTDKEGKASIEFSNNIMNNGYGITINGMSENYTPGSFHKTYEYNSDKILKPVSDTLIDITINTTTGVLCKYAEIQIANGAIIPQTSVNSIFTINREDLRNCDTLKVSIPGYGNRNMTIQELRDENFVIKVPHDVTQKDTIDNLKKLIKLVFRKQVMNRPSKAFDINGVFRQLLYSGNELSGLTDFSFIQRKNGVGNTSDTHFNNIEQVNQFRVQNYNKKVPFELLNQQSDFLPKLDPTNIDLSFMKDELFDRYDLAYKGSQLFNGRESYIITFEPKAHDPLALYSGMVIVDKATYAIAHIHWSVPNKKKNMVDRGNYLAPQIKEPVFSLISDLHHATYTIVEEKWKLKSASQQLSFIHNRTRYSVKNEMLATQYFEKRTKQLIRTIPNRMNGKSSLNKKVSYTPGNWRQDNVLLPDVKTQIQIEGLYEHTVFE